MIVNITRPSQRTFKQQFADRKVLRFVLIVTFFLYASSEICFGQLYPETAPGFFAGQAVKPSVSPEPGLLFYLSGENEFKADFAAGGQDMPNFLRGLKTIAGGAIGKAFEADDTQLMSYWAPGNIFSQRGTLSFYWRSRYPVGPTQFPVFRVAFADNTSLGYGLAPYRLQRIWF